MIQKMIQRQQEQDCPEDPVLRDLRVLMEEGAVVVHSCFSEIRVWNIYKKYKYTNKLRKLDESLDKQLGLLNVRIAVVADENNGMLHEILEIVNPNKSSQIEARFALPELPPLIVGLDNPLEELKSELFKDEVKLLVLTAPGGCGKTTLASKFCQDQQVKDKFKDNIFFVTVSKKPNLELIMTDLYNRKGYWVPTCRNGVFPVKWLQQIVKEEGDNPILLVLDDVWSGSESLLEKFESIECRMSNYKILVTSRSEFPRFGSSYHLQLLDDNNAMQLFRHTASLGDKSSHIPIDLSKKIVKHCNGFPLAITVVGRSLCGQPIETWRDRVNELSKGASILDCEMEMFKCLQSSFDALDEAKPLVKECLLDLGAFPEDAGIQVTALIDMWAQLHDLDDETSCIAKLYELNNRSLALLDKNWNKGVEVLEAVPEAQHCGRYVVRQHDLLRELAIYNPKVGSMDQRERLIIEICGNNFPKWWREQKYPCMNARLVSISTDGEFSEKFPNLNLPKAEVLVLNFQARETSCTLFPDGEFSNGELSDAGEFSDRLESDYQAFYIESKTSYALPEFVERIEQLKVLLAINNSSSICDEMDNIQLLGSLSHLRSIRLDGINCSCLTKSPVQLKNLDKLYLRGATGKYLSDDPGKLLHVFPNLKEMVIDDSELWKFPAELCELIHLTKLRITNCWECSVSPEAIDNLVSLEMLSLVGCTHLFKVPDSIGNLKKLTFFQIAKNLSLMELPDNMGKLKSLRHLIIYDCVELSSLPESIGHLVNLEVLCLRKCGNLPELPQSIRNLRKLNILDIHHCSSIEKLPEHIGDLKSLRKLEMVDCCGLRNLPKSVSDLEQLEEVMCNEWHATHLWTPFSCTLKNLSIVASKGEIHGFDWRRGEYC